MSLADDLETALDRAGEMAPYVRILVRKLGRIEKAFYKLSRIDGTISPDPDPIKNAQITESCGGRNE